MAEQTTVTLPALDADPITVLNLVIAQKLAPEAYAEWTRQREEQIKTQAAAQARKENQRDLSLKVSMAGAVSLYGLSAQFPTTLYAQQWRRLLDFAPQIEAYIAQGEAQTSTHKLDTEAKREQFAKLKDRSHVVTHNAQEVTVRMITSKAKTSK